MCYGCYEEEGCPAIINERTIEAAKLIEELYDQPDCGAGGDAHVVVDDWNLEDRHIENCLEAMRRHSDLTLEAFEVVEKCLIALKGLSKEERHSAMAIHRGFIKLEA